MRSVGSNPTLTTIFWQTKQQKLTDFTFYEIIHTVMNTKNTKKLQKPRNFVAKDLFTPKYRMKVEHSATNFYSRAAEKQNFRKNYAFF